MVVLEDYLGHNDLSDKRIIVTGTGYKPAKKIFYHRITGKPLHNPIVVDGIENKLNIGAACALQLACEGATVHMVSRTSEKLQNLRQHICELAKCYPSKVEWSAVDLNDKEEVKSFVENIPKNKSIYWVHSVGLGAGSYKLKDDNPYLLFEEMNDDLPVEESKIVLWTTKLLGKYLLPIFKSQKESRVVGISSMSAIRTYPGGSSHCAAKAAIHMMYRTLAIEWEPYNIFVTEVMPGIIDTGMYDKDAVIKAIERAQKEYNRPHENVQIPLAPPSSVADLVVIALKSNGHCLDMRLIAHKQWPWNGS